MVLDSISGEYLCMECGLVEGGHLLDFSPAVFGEGYGDPTEKPSHEKGSFISNETKGVSCENQAIRLRKTQRFSVRYRGVERNLRAAVPFLDLVASQMGLPNDIRVLSKEIYRKCLDKNLVRGRSSKAFSAAAIYGACRELGYPRSIEEFSSASGVPGKQIGRSYRNIKSSLGLEILPASPADSDMRGSDMYDPRKYLPTIASNLGLSMRTLSVAKEILDKAMSQNLSGRSPPALAAAASYLASQICGEKRTQKEVASVALVSSATVGIRAKELSEMLRGINAK